MNEDIKFVPVVPPGKAMGCLPRVSLPGALCPLFSERVKVIPKNQWGDYSTDLTPFVKVILDQDGVGSCAAESTTQSVMMGRAFSGLGHVLLNPWSLYHFTSHGRDAGSSIDENLQVARDQGICPESVWPRSKGWKPKPSEEAMAAAELYRIDEFFDITSIEEFVSALLLGFPVVWGANGHAIVAVQYTVAYPKIANSWDVSWGESGFGKWVGWSAINWQYGAFAVRTVAQT